MLFSLGRFLVLGNVPETDDVRPCGCVGTCMQVRVNAYARCCIGTFIRRRVGLFVCCRADLCVCWCIDPYARCRIQAKTYCCWMPPQRGCQVMSNSRSAFRIQVSCGTASM
jgi:hypothetical protein